MIFGSYCQAIYETNSTNTKTARKLGVIYLLSLDKLQGIFEAESLLPGNIIYHRKVITIPIIQEFSYIVEALANKNGIRSLLKLIHRKEVTIR